MSPDLRMTVAVVVKDRRDLMARCLAGIERLDHDDFEVVTVDNGSTDGTREMLAAWAARAPVPARAVEQEGTVGRARNRALTEARGDLIAFTDSDCVPDPGWLKALEAAMEPGVAVVQGRTVPFEPVTRSGAATQAIGSFTDLYEACNICYRTSALREAGGFDADIGLSNSWSGRERIAFGEDTAAGWAVRRRGGRGAFASDAVVAHEVTYPDRSWHLRRAFGYRSWNRLVREFPEMRRELLFAGIFLRPRNAALVAAVAGIGLAASGRRRGLALTVPYLWFRGPRRPTGDALLDALGGMLFDLAGLAGLVRGSVAERTVVL